MEKTKMEWNFEKCEVCGHDYNHVKQVYITKHGEKDEPELVTIEIDCEICGARWALVLLQTKGQLVMQRKVIRRFDTCQN